MRIELAMACALLCFAINTAAFEPGSERVCIPSADGQSFECRDKTTGELDAPAAKPARTTPPMANPAIASPSAPPASDPAPQAPASTPATLANDNDPTVPSPRKLPSYLMQHPQTTGPASVADQPRVPAATDVPRASATPASKPAVAPAPKIPTATAPSTTPGAPVKASLSPPASIPQPSPQVAAKPSTPPPPAVATSDRFDPASRKVSDASAFRALPAAHYTIVLASVRNPAALDALVLALAELPGALYRLKLSMPDGDWYSLCWSDFADVETARAARASLPGDVGITSGWPRKVGLLQQEIAR